MASLVRFDVSVSLIWALFLLSYLRSCGGISEINAYPSTKDNTTRPETTIPQGRVRGINLLTRHEREIFGFLGIPFAEPPVGKLRFAAPIPPQAWNGTLDASSEANLCPQLNLLGIPDGSEDCLYLNLYTPKLPTSDNSTLLPVMVYVVGGAFIEQNTSILIYSPDFLLDKDVLLVVPNFRVGALGFLSTGDEVAPGNFGLKDMVRALQWVQENIEYFGGDPNRVTLYGGSSGSTSVHLLVLSDLTNGLIHRYITQSGSALAVNFQQSKEVYAKYAFLLGKKVGCPMNTSTLLIDCLRRIDVTSLVTAIQPLLVLNSTKAFIWAPTYEVDIDGALITDTPANLVANGKIRDLPWMSSIVRDEGLTSSIYYYEHPDSFEILLENLDYALPLTLAYKNVVDNVTAYTAGLMSYYLNDLTADRSILLNNLTELNGDTLIVYPTYTAHKQQLIYAKSPQYLCFFNYRGVFSHSYHFSHGSTHYTNIVHGDEIIYLFLNREYRFGPPGYEYSETDWKMVDTVVQLWTSFAINGTPSMTGLNTTAVWEPYSSKKNYLRIGTGFGVALETEYDLFKERMEFWDKLNAGTSDGFRNPLQIMPIAFCLCLLLQFSLLS